MAFDESDELVVGTPAYFQAVDLKAKSKGGQGASRQRRRLSVDVKAARSRHVTVDGSGAFLNLKDSLDKYDSQSTKASAEGDSDFSDDDSVSSCSDMPPRDERWCDADTTALKGLGVSSQLTRLIGGCGVPSKPSAGRSPWESPCDRGM